MKNSHNSEDTRHIQSVFRALKIMEYIATHENFISLTEISKGMELSKSTTFGLIATLEQYGYMQQDPLTGKYGLGLKTFELGQAYISRLDLREIALPEIKKLALQYQETVHLAVLFGEDVVYIDKVDGSRSIGIRSRIGGRNPAYCTGVGKVLLSGLSSQKIEQTYAGKTLQKYTNNTTTDLAELINQTQQVYKTGYALDMEEFELGLRCIAAPIKDNKGIVIAAISLSGPANRLLDTNINTIAIAVAAAAMQISMRLGYK